jgi:hypothetical protein
MGAGLPIESLEDTMAKTNFQYEKRQRELEKKRKTEEKARRKQDSKHKEPGAEDAPAQEGGSDEVQQVQQAHDAV